MKKIILGLAIIAGGGLFSFLPAAQNSGLLLGVNVGVPITSPSYGGALNSMKSGLPSNGIGWAASIDIGYKQALSNNMGLKYYLEYNYNASYGNKEGGSVMFSKVKADIKQQLITLNVDYYFNPTDLFGVYVGLGVGYQTFKPTWTPTMAGGVTTMTFGGENKGGLAVPLNLGLTFNVNESNQILIGAKIPLVAYDYKTTVLTQAANVKLSTYIVQVGYNYTF
ncbi:hypothetical protein CCY99_02460 [Helicobacter sp. 16-1353]|uniref:outer membrane beta-barrel protein n=1 Tax=Helicobacter sp. 16-1353 TaxID=2004996 RepID=UPI000DCE7FD7|nr:outer membrane beta-barrel protein [Helicobacter sp. 16-1353]RAX54645.1 hypothetical protein CCY99_02460 [Helicobacter sp. 16-1353]